MPLTTEVGDQFGEKSTGAEVLPPGPKVCRGRVFVLIAVVVAHAVAMLCLHNAVLSIYNVQSLLTWLGLGVSISVLSIVSYHGFDWTRYATIGAVWFAALRETGVTVYRLFNGRPTPIVEAAVFVGLCLAVTCLLLFPPSIEKFFSYHRNFHRLARDRSRSMNALPTRRPHDD